MSEVQVKVLLNMSSFLMPYRADDQLLQALSFTTGFPACGHVEMLLRIVFEQLNIPRPRAEWAIQYRMVDQHRSMSVGDVIVVGEQAFAVEPTGWLPITITADQIWVTDIAATCDSYMNPN
jgi:hypothetical protein